MSDPAIRAATPEDVPAIRRVGERAWRAAYGEFLPESVIESAMAEWYDPGTLKESLASEDVEFLVADGERGVVGYLSGRPSENPGVAVLGAINVDPDRWNEGIGSALLSAFEASCRHRDRVVVRARVLAENDVGQPFYRARGYEAIKEREVDLFGTTVRERLFQRSL